MAISEAARFPELGLGSIGEEAGGGIALVVLGILALANVEPMLLNSIAIIVAGVSLAVGGAALTARQAKLMAEAMPERTAAGQLSTGTSAGILGGGAGVVLGILALIGVASEPLVAIALIVFGASLMFDYGARAQMRMMRAAGASSSAEAARFAMTASTSNSAILLVGVGLITLGIVALAHIVAPVVSAAAILALGTYLLLEGGVAAGLLAELATAQ